MALVTRCPNCFTIFRITPLHLQAHSGKVRCGQCSHIFNGFATLLTAEEPEIIKPVKTEEAAKTPESAQQFSAEALLSAQTGFSPTDRDLSAGQGAMPSSHDMEISRRQAIQSRGMPGLAASEPTASAPLKPEGEEARAPETRSRGKSVSKAAKIAGGARDRRPARRQISQMDDGMYAGLEDEIPDNYLPEHYVSNRGQLPEITMAWAVANLFMLIVLVAQITYAFRSELASSMPATRSFLEQYCKVLQCTVSLPSPIGSGGIAASGTILAPSVQRTAAADDWTSCSRSLPQLPPTLLGSANSLTPPILPCRS